MYCLDRDAGTPAGSRPAGNRAHLYRGAKLGSAAGRFCPQHELLSPRRHAFGNVHRFPRPKHQPQPADFIKAPTTALSFMPPVDFNVPGPAGLRHLTQPATSSSAMAINTVGGATCPSAALTPGAAYGSSRSIPPHLRDLISAGPALALDSAGSKHVNSIPNRNTFESSSNTNVVSLGKEAAGLPPTSDKIKAVGLDGMADKNRPAKPRGDVKTSGVGEKANLPQARAGEGVPLTWASVARGKQGDFGRHY